MAVEVNERIAERRREVRDQRRRRRLRRTVTVASLLVLAAIAVAVERSPLVALSEVRVEGSVRMDPDEIRAAADLPLGTSTVRLRLGAAEARVEALPAVATAQARRLDPLTVLIEITERVPVLVASNGTRSVLLDADGVSLASGDQPGLPRITVPVGGDLPGPGEQASAVPAVANAHAAFHGLSGPLRAEVVTLEAAGSGELDLLLASGVRVRFGRAERLEEKSRALGAVLEEAGEGVTVIDVRAPRTPVVVR